MNAQASVSGNPGDALAAQMYALTNSEQAQRDALKAQLIGTFGDTVTTGAFYADRMVLLEKTLGEERLAVQTSYNNRLAASATGAVTNLASYAMKLQFGTTSPLSPQAQYGLASNQFNAVAGSAQAGNFNSYSNIQSYADSFLNSSKAYNGSGAVYTADFNRVLDVLTSLANVTPDTLTASIYAAQVQSQTDALVEALTSVRNEVAALRQQVNAPARLTA
jgi:hypothetical protein